MQTGEIQSLKKGIYEQYQSEAKSVDFAGEGDGWLACRIEFRENQWNQEEGWL